MNDLPGVRDEPGSVAFLRVAEVDPAPHLRWIRDAQRETGPCPFILEVMGIHSPGSVHNSSSLPPSLATLFGLVTSRAGLRGVRMTTLGPAERDEVRSCLTSRVGLLQSVRLWLYRTHPELRTDPADIALRCIGEGAEDEDAVGGSSVGTRTAARSLVSAGLPPPSLLRAVGRILPPVLALQADPGLPVADAARPLFPSEEAFKKAFRRVVGGSLGQLRVCWGAEAVLARAFESWREGDRIGQK